VVLFEWDPTKERSNVRKHGISFDVARLVFDDPDAISDQDRFEGGEYRWQTIGLVNGVLMLTVAYTVRDGAEAETIRIISARRASRWERRRYEGEIDTSQW
jgi:uncharacterized DUF497 family protein